MNRKKWRGSALFILILTVMGVTIGLRLYGVGQTVTASTSIVSPTTAAATPAAATPTASASASSSASATPTPSASSSSASTVAAATKTVAGDVEQTRYGALQVQITATGKTITAVTVLQSPNDEGRSVEINAQADPILAQEVIASQSANIDTVSGATYTSDGYRQSLQSAIDKL